MTGIQPTTLEDKGDCGTLTFGFDSVIIENFFECVVRH